MDNFEGSNEKQDKLSLRGGGDGFGGLDMIMMKDQIVGYGGIKINYTLSMRDRLPALVPLNQSYSIWAILKEAIGKDLSKITMPIFLNEPLGML